MKLPQYTTWLAYKKSMNVALSISKLTGAKFPKHERYSLTDQIKRSSRSVGANLAESAGKAGYPRHFTSKLADAISENYETQHWLICAHNERYIEQSTLHTYLEATNEIGKLLNYMRQNPGQYISLKKIGPR